MKKTTLLKITLALLFLIGTSQIFAQERIAVIQDSQIRILDVQTGDIIDPSFITLDSGTPKALLQVDDEIWVSYQLGDKIERYDLQGNLVSTIDSGLDNIRGLSVVNDIEVWVCNSGGLNGAPENAIVRFDFDGNNLGTFSAAPESNSPFDIVDNGIGEVYISYSSSSNIERRDYNGTFLGNIVEPDVVSFVQQLEIDSVEAIYAAVFSIINGGNQNGLYRFSTIDGSILDYYSLGNLRGVIKLGDGNVLYSSGAGVFKLDIVTGASTEITSGSAQFFGRLIFDNCTTLPTPTGDAQQTFIDGATLADIVVNPTDVTWFATEADALTNTDPLPLSTVLETGQTYFAVNIVDGCLSEPFAVTVTIILGIDNFSSLDLKYYPNPTSGILTISNRTIISEITVSNMLGQSIYNSKPQSEEVTLDLSTAPSGIYLVKINIEGISNTIKIVKK